jgi:hypothetical protein
LIAEGNWWSKKMKKLFKITAIVLAAIYFVIAPLVIAMIHG